MSTEVPQPPAAKPRAPVIRLDNLGDAPRQRILKRQMPAWFISLLFHSPFIMLFLAYLIWPGVFGFLDPKKVGAETTDTTIATQVDEEEAKKDFENPDIGLDANLPTNYNIDRIEDHSVPGLLRPEEPIGNGGPDTTPQTVPPPPGIMTEGGTGSGIDSPIAGTGAMTNNPGGMNGIPGLNAGFAGRSGATRQKMLTEGGGNTVSEAAVTRGLIWLQKVQKTNGSWEIDGNHKSNIAGTGIALLPFLAAGQTHKSGNKEMGNGKYIKTVDNGLKFLLTKQKADGSFTGGPTMYDHAIATMALCEAFGMTNDPKLKGPAQLATTYIVKAQHSAGGWRYSPGQAGDTSVTGWQIQALKSALLAGLSVEKNVATKASSFLDTVAGGSGSAKGSTYGYTDGNGSPSMAAVGLLCRQYLGWGPKNPKLAEGIKVLKMTPPRKDKADPRMFDIYYYYYATQVVHFFGGPEWSEEWNPKMRDWLIDLQVKGNPQNEGSWNPDGGHTGGAGGRLVTSCLSLLTLEVYYRHLPLYKRDAGMKDLDN